MKRKSYTFQELTRIAEKYYSDTNCCGVIAVCSAAQVAFGKSRAMLERKGRPHRKGTPVPALLATLEELGCSIETVYDWWTSPRHTVNRVCKELDKGKVYLVRTTRHIFCVDHGVINDWMDKGRRHHVRELYIVTRNY